MTDFSTPRRMSPGAFVIMFLKSFKDIVGAAFVVLVYMLYNSHDSGGRLFWKFALAAGIILTYSLAVAFTRYYFRKFHIEGDKLIYTRGLAEEADNKHTAFTNPYTAHKKRIGLPTFYPCAVSLSTLLQATSRKWS